MKQLLSFVFALYVALTFFISVLITFPIIAIASLGNSKGSRKWIHAYIRGWCTFWLWIIGMPLTVRGHRPKNKKVIVVANHISYLDTLVIFPAVGAYFKPLGKIEMVSIPIFGYIYSQVVIAVDRGSTMSRAKSLRQMHNTLEREGSIVIFPEGGFNETDTLLRPFYDGAFRLSIKTGIAIVPLVLPDTLNRWHYSKWYKLWPGKNRAIFLEPIVPGETDDIKTLKERVFKVMEAELRKHRPTNNEPINSKTRYN